METIIFNCQDTSASFHPCFKSIWFPPALYKIGFSSFQMWVSCSLWLSMAFNSKKSTPPGIRMQQDGKEMHSHVTCSLPGTKDTFYLLDYLLDILQFTTRGGIFLRLLWAFEIKDFFSSMQFWYLFSSMFIVLFNKWQGSLRHQHIKVTNLRLVLCSCLCQKGPPIAFCRKNMDGTALSKIKQPVYFCTEENNMTNLRNTTVTHLISRSGQLFCALQESKFYFWILQEITRIYYQYLRERSCPLSIIW